MAGKTIGEQLKNLYMEIVCSTDNNYVMPTGVMMCSLCENNRGEQVRFHVLSSDITDANKSALRRIADGYGKDIEFHKINDADLADFPIGRDGQSAHISSLATYYRLFLGDILPDSITKVIYLDGDLIVRKSLKELWDTDMDGYAIAGAPDTGNNGVEHYNRLLYPQSLGYFNAGVLVINLEYWRSHGSKNEFFKIAREHPERLRCHDQDILNYVFRTCKKRLDAKFNFQNDYLFEHRYANLTYDILSEIDASIADPVIIHYITGPKPWQRDCIHPYRNEFLKYRDKTQWKGMKLMHGDPLKVKIKHRLVKILIDLGFFKRENLVAYKFRKDAILTSV